ncbi:MAG: 3-oxoacyl-ACP reductase, partial [Alphaproteobacteria bacterium]
MGERLEGKVAIVTGAGSSGPGWGNGKATAVLYAREGARLLLVDRDGEAAAETAAIIDAEGGVARCHPAD